MSHACLIRPAPAIDRQPSPPFAILPDLYTKSCLLLQHQGLSHAPTSTAQASQSTDWVFGSWKRGESGLASITSSPLVPSRNRALRSTLYDKNRPTLPVLRWRSPITIDQATRKNDCESFPRRLPSTMRTLNMQPMKKNMRAKQAMIMLK